MVKRTKKGNLKQNKDKLLSLIENKIDYFQFTLNDKKIKINSLEYGLSIPDEKNIKVDHLGETILIPIQKKWFNTGISSLNVDFMKKLGELEELCYGEKFTVDQREFQGKLSMLPGPINTLYTTLKKRENLLIETGKVEINDSEIIGYWPNNQTMKFRINKHELVFFKTASFITYSHDDKNRTNWETDIKNSEKKYTLNKDNVLKNLRKIYGEGNIRDQAGTMWDDNGAYVKLKLFEEDYKFRNADIKIFPNDEFLSDITNRINELKQEWID